MLGIDKDVCFYCGTCVNVCPQGAIELLDKGETAIDEDCVEHICKKWNCRLCVKSCPVGAIYGI
jgi:NAD-dependent dihydropyrimidine dehydrogenase PreA subunit